MNNQDDSKVAEINNMSGRTPSVGNMLREAREQLGMSVNDVANRIKFAPRQIESLEADDYVRLPEAAFVRGFVRSYARLLELDPAVLLASLPTSHVPTASTQPVKSVMCSCPLHLLPVSIISSGLRRRWWLRCHWQFLIVSMIAQL